MMAERDLNNAFDDCLNRLNDGEPLQTCLDVYPQFAAELRPMLQAGLAIKQARPNPLEVQLAQNRGRARVLQALQQPQSIRRQRGPALQRLIATAAILVLIMGSFLGGATLAAESSLPGDSLYNLKRLIENVRLLANTQLAEQFGQRRLDEIRQLQALQRSENVDFTGRVTAMDGPNWEVAGFALTVPPLTPGSEIVLLYAQVAVQALTTTTGELIAQRVAVIEQGELPPVSPTIAPTRAPTSTTTPTPTQTPAPTAASTLLPAANGCVPAAPEGWVTYAIQVGDTLIGLANQTGITLEQLMMANCLEDARLIIAGQRIFLPFAPASNPPENNQSGNSEPGGGQSGDDDDNSGPSENSGPGNADDDDNSGSGSGNSGSGSSDDDDD